MRPIRISGAEDKPLGAPSDWDPDRHGHCAALFIRRDHAEGHSFMRSAWEVEITEAAMLYAGARIILGIAGDCHPVVNLQVADLPAVFEPVVHARRFTHASGKPCVRVEMLFCHANGSRAYCESFVEDSFGQAVAWCIKQIEDLAKEKGWTT